MNNFFDKYTISIGAQTESPFLQRDNNYQDGTTPMYRDVDGRLWAMSGHSHMGSINMYCGKSLDDLKKEHEKKCLENWSNSVVSAVRSIPLRLR